ncbi:MAG: bacterial transcriptional activator domain-containing protein, partial [Caldilineaceae bacterium]|nr:bacterial transcriptional activator domain-containing protein [Caldilineaceae bacterium]
MRGDFLEAFALDDSPGFEEWALLQRESYRRLYSEALRDLAQTYEERGNVDRALDYARRWLAQDPWHEGAHRQIMRLLATGGDRTAALA